MKYSWVCTSFILQILKYTWSILQVYLNIGSINEVQLGMYFIYTSNIEVHLKYTSLELGSAAQ